MFRTRSRFRSKWKPIYAKVFPLNLTKISRIRRLTIVDDRSSTILPCHVGYNFRISTGQKFLLKKITKEMVGFKFGEFIVTTKLGKDIHKTLKNKLKKR